MSHVRSEQSDERLKSARVQSPGLIIIIITTIKNKTDVVAGACSHIAGQAEKDRCAGLTD